VSAADVTFHTQDWEPASHGAEQQFSFACPKRHGERCEGLVIAGRTMLKRHPQSQDGGIAQWDFDGNRDAPTFSPSINCGYCGWHGYIRSGRCVSTNGADEP
jgi:hypothetical protein